MNRPQGSREERAARAWRMSVEGRTQEAIADELGVSQGQVSRLLARARRAAWDRLSEETATYVILSLRQIDELLWESLQALERSARPARRTRRRGGTLTVEVRERAGDPAFLHQALGAIRLRVELLARFAPDPGPPPGDGASGPADLARALIEAEARDAAHGRGDGPA